VKSLAVIYQVPILAFKYQAAEEETGCETNACQGSTD
jgi:hypothetical protein